MSENEETKWRLGVEPQEAEGRAAELSSEEDEKKEELQQTIQTNVEEIGGGGEASLITRPEEEPITGALQRRERIAKARRPTTKRESDSSMDIAKISKQLEGQSKQLARIEKVILPPLQKSINKIDKQSSTIKQLYNMVTQLQRRIIRSTNSQGKKPANRSKKRRSLKGRRSR
jgi:hypothetical protein